MSERDFLQLALYLVVLLALTPLLGGWMARIYLGERHLLHKILGSTERLIYRLAGCNPNEEMDWRRYVSALLWFNLLGFVAVFGLQLLQAHLPLNPQKFS